MLCVLLGSISLSGKSTVHLDQVLRCCHQLSRIFLLSKFREFHLFRYYSAFGNVRAWERR
jgi:hypothetical protein